MLHGPPLQLFKKILADFISSSVFKSMLPKFYTGNMENFLRAARTNYHKFSNLEQYKFIILQLWNSEIRNGFLEAKTKILEAVVENPTSLPS